MVSAAAAIRQAIEAKSPVSDGRRARSLASRTKIIEAMINLVAAGNHPNPSTSSAVERAVLGLPSVFRHFEDKDSILRKIDRSFVRVYQPILNALYESSDWKDQLFDLIERRAIMIATGFNTWRLLRQDEEPSFEETVSSIKELVGDTLERAES